MMNKQEVKDKFVELRIAGETVDTITKTPKVSQQTLINWSKEIQVREASTTARLMNFKTF